MNIKFGPAGKYYPKGKYPILPEWFKPYTIAVFINDAEFPDHYMSIKNFNSVPNHFVWLFWLLILLKKEE